MHPRSRYCETAFRCGASLLLVVLTCVAVASESPGSDKRGVDETGAPRGRQGLIHAGWPAQAQSRNLSLPIDLGMAAPRVATAMLVVDTPSDASPGVAANCMAGSSLPCSLRDAIAAGNAQPGSTITFDPAVFAVPQTILLTQGTLLVSSDVTLTGPGAALLQVSGGRTTAANGVPVFRVIGNGATPSVTFAAFTISKGNVTQYRSDYTTASILGGGGIFNDASLLLEDMVVTDNQANGPYVCGGAGIYSNGLLSISRSRITGNQATSLGTIEFGGVYGGGIWSSGPLDFNDSELRDNTAISLGRSAQIYGGGAFLNVASHVRRSSITGNLAQNKNDSGIVYGGGVALSGDVIFDFTTIAGNSAQASGSATQVAGGAIWIFYNFTFAGDAELNNVTVSGNSIVDTTDQNSGSGGGIAALGNLRVANSIVGGNRIMPADASNLAYADIDDSVTVAPLTDAGGNLYGSDPSKTSLLANLALGPLGNYGGTTLAILPLPGSRAICAGTLANQQVTSSGIDQRGAATPDIDYVGYSSVNPCVDAGAVQTHYALSFLSQPTDVTAGTNFSPAVTVQTLENGVSFSSSTYAALTASDFAGIDLSVAANAGSLNANTSAVVDPATGIATFTGLGVAPGASAQPGTRLSATLVLDTAPTASARATSNAFSLLQPSSVSLSATPASGSYGAPVVLTATVSTSPAAPTGTVSFNDAGTLIQGCSSRTVSLLGGVHTATCALNATNGNLPHAGTHAIVASYGGDTLTAAALSPKTDVVVAPASQQISFGPAPPLVAGGSAWVAASGGASGNPVLFATTSAAAICTVSGAGLIAATGSGTCVVTANQAGTPDYAAAAQAMLAVPIGQAVSAVVLTAAPSPSVYGENLVLSVAVTANSPGGSVDFLDGGTLLGSATLSAATATFSTGTLSTGIHALYAVYGGDANNLAATSAPLQLQVDPAATKTQLIAPATATIGQPIGLMVTLAIIAPGSGTPTGNVIVSDGATDCTVTLPATGCTFSPTITGARTLTSSYAGDANFAVSASSVMLDVLPETAQITLSATPVAALVGQPVTLTATITASTSPTGTVTFNDGATLLGAAVVDNQGLGTLVTSTLSQGTHTIVATYSGDDNHAGATTSLTLQVNAVPVAVPVPVSTPEMLTLLVVLLLFQGAWVHRGRK